MQTRTRRQNFVLILALGILNALTPFSIDMYLPSFPEIAHDFRVSVAQVALSVSIYFIGYAFGQIIYGPFLDRFGRKKPVLIGLLIYIFSTIGCVYAGSLNSLLIFRFFAAIGGSAAGVGATAMVRDFFRTDQIAKIFSLLMLVLSASPLLAPSLGSLVITYAHWRVIFALLAAMGVLNLLMVIYILPHGYEPDRNIELRLKPIFRNFKHVLHNSQFLTYTLAGSFSFAGLFVYVAGSPAIFMDGFHVSAKVYGAIFAFLAVGMIGGGQLNLLFVRKLGEKRVFRNALTLQVIGALLFFAGTLFGLYGLYETIGFLFVILLCSGLTSPNAAALALAPFSKNAGSAASLLGFLQLGIGSLASAVVGLLETKGSLPTALVMCLSSCVALGILIATKSKVETHANSQ
jgi:DHA1 family bicyclomycin/chloramphenicol resistance-like MFS transporter